jgi:cytochrome b6-f complex iron-sulfur subunit
MSEEQPKDPPRRDFLGMAVGGSATAFAVAMGYPVVRYVQPEHRQASGPVTVGKLEEFPVGVAKTVLAHDRPVLVIRGTDGQFRAFSAICTHLQCVVGWSQERGQIECPCHGGIYGSDGERVAGPPPRRLDELVVSINEGSIIVSTA